MDRTRWKAISHVLFIICLLATLLGSAVFAPGVRAAVIVVTSTANAGPGTLRQAVADAAAGDTITFGVSGTITLTTEIRISKNLTINGPGAANLTLSGGGSTRLLFVDPVSVNISHLTIANGFSGNQDGGGIYNFNGVLSVDDVTFTNNRAPGGVGGAIYKNQGSLVVTNSSVENGYASYGAGILATDASLVVTNSSFTANTAVNWGGGIYMDPGSNPANTLLVLGSTFNSNHAAQGGGINRVSAAADVLANSTFSANTATSLGGGLFNDGVGTLSVVNNTFSENSAAQGGGIINIGKMSLINNILANSPSGQDCRITNGTWGTVHDNLIETGNCPFTNNADPLLDSLRDNGGRTLTYALLPGSPAIDIGDDAACASPPVSHSDQRGKIRPLDGNGDGMVACDLGAYEVLEPTVTTITGDNPDPSQRGESIQVKVTVAGSSSKPSGMVEITGAETNCVITLVAETGSCDVTFQNRGARTLTAVYAGDATHRGSQDSESHTVNAVATTTTITASSPNPSRSGQPVNVTYTVVPAIPGDPPTGNVTVSDGVDSCTGTVTAGGCTLSLTTNGVRTLTATYLGDENFDDSSGTRSHTVDGTPPQVGSIQRADASPTNDSSVGFNVTFNEPVTGVDASDFTLATGGSLSGSSVSAVSGTGAVYAVTVETGSGTGSLRLDVSSAASISDMVGNSFVGPYTAGESYFIDRDAPQVVSSLRIDGNPLCTPLARFRVTFNEVVSGVDASDFALTLSGGVTGAAVTGVSGSGTVYTVTVSTGIGAGSLRLDVLDDHTILDAAGNSLAGGYSSGQAYDVGVCYIMLPIMVNRSSGGR